MTPDYPKEYVQAVIVQMYKERAEERSIGKMTEATYVFIICLLYAWPNLLYAWPNGSYFALSVWSLIFVWNFYLAVKYFRDWKSYPKGSQ